MLGGKESLEPAGEDLNSGLGRRNSVLQADKPSQVSSSRKRKMIRVLFPKDYSGGSVEGKIRVRRMWRTCRDKVLIKDAKSPSQATAVGQLGGNREGLCPEMVQRSD